ncbi:MAG TPA: hypothetical protein VGM27_15325, partial [Acidobacteriaceae bacterium]
YVDGFWLDTTNVSPMNKFATLVRATGYVTVAECTPKRRTFRCGPGESGAGLSRLHAARSSRPFEQSPETFGNGLPIGIGLTLNVSATLARA